MQRGNAAVCSGLGHAWRGRAACREPFLLSPEVSARTPAAPLVLTAPAPCSVRFPRAGALSHFQLRGGPLEDGVHWHTQAVVLVGDCV